MCTPPAGRNISSKPAFTKSLAPLLFAIAVFQVTPFTASAQTQVEDIFGRSLNQHGLTLVDWEGHLANPLVKFFIRPPTNSVLPGTAVLTANGARLYFTTPSTVSSNGPAKTVSLTTTSNVPVSISIFPDRDGLDEDYTLTIVFTGANTAKQTNTLPIHVIDQDIVRTNDFTVIENFDRDTNAFFTNPIARAEVKQAAEDWAYFFAGMNLDTVAVGTEPTYIWSNNFSGGYYFTNTNSYKGYQLYAHSNTNAAHTSGGQGSYTGSVQTSGGLPLNMKRSGSFSAEFYGNYNTLGWLFLTNDNDWLASDNFDSHTNDFYSVAHHEIGHALIFDTAHPGFNNIKNTGAFRSIIVTNYYGGPVTIDSVSHLTNAIDPESGQGAFGNEYNGLTPRRRWTITKLDIYCAQATGYTLRPTSAFAPLLFPSNAFPAAMQTVPFNFSFTSTGGIPFYNWEITGGASPPGLTLDPFSGALTGTPTTNGLFSFNVRVRDYHETGSGLTRAFNLNVSGPPPVTLGVDFVGGDTNLQSRIQLSGTTGQKQVIEASSDLVNWDPIATNATGTNVFQFLADYPATSPQRFYRAVVLP